ncbi:DUF6372 family protein [Streptomyces roseoverticillatus]|uniref:DUF6372 family protein n=1 Tax=Streptomyces roseoverticillatus TaxID=66429 RepID=UPI0004C19CCD|nr:DUF6372 family protein [Streptomyces roseoverticillatus]
MGSVEQVEPCHCVCALAHHGMTHICSEEAYPGLALTLRVPALGSMSFPVCETCYDAASPRWHHQS